MVWREPCYKEILVLNSTPSTKKKKGYHHGNLRQSLVDTAVELISERNHCEFTLRELAKKLDVTHAATYHHFRDKDALLSVVAQQGYISLNQELYALDHDEPMTLLCAFFLTYLNFALNHQSHYRVMFDHRLNVRVLMSDLQAEVMRTHSLMYDLVQQCQQAELLNADVSTDVLCTLYWATFRGLAINLVNDPHSTLLPPEEHLHTFLSLIFSGSATLVGLDVFSDISI